MCGAFIRFGAIEVTAVCVRIKQVWMCFNSYYKSPPIFFFVLLKEMCEINVILNSRFKLFYSVGQTHEYY